MSYETSKGIISVNIEIPPEIPLNERISSILPGWEISRQNDIHVAITTEDKQKLISMFKSQNRTEIVCVSEYKRNSQNLRELSNAISKIAKLAEKSNEIEAKLKKSSVINTLIYPVLPTAIDDREVTEVLDMVRNGRLESAILTSNEGITYGLGNGEKKFTVGYSSTLAEVPTKYPEVLKKFELSEKHQTNKKPIYVS